jgi:hypothetical protein
MAFDGQIERLKQGIANHGVYERGEILRKDKILLVTLSWLSRRTFRDGYL